MTAAHFSFTAGTLVDSAPARVSMAAPCGRLSLRARGDLAPLGAALGTDLPGRIGRRAGSGDTDILCLGPDEWAIHLPEARLAEVEAAFAGVYASHPHSLVDVSGAEVTFVVEGPRAAELLTLGCPRDIDTIAPGEGRRTVFDGATVILWRDAATRFRLDVRHSFAPHLFALLDTGCRELAAEPR